ncbi:uncharacterized protein DUF1631 [Variovorax beijingensis]|uniref:DUF1631 domain-containing protein n=2 Tax=Variovorax TaxID=34072 RepID=A0AAE3XX61_VARPD|nr:MULTISPECIES: DUF1631 family protein [Variovorax]MBD9668209.1 DUF1631 family protein [Variovorax sp. VRV01]MDP9965899.1 hypothetical protein [Variovorax paradoxus]MDR6425742.1 hypothetical protein [Variovorax paradoxus]MDR6453015.1 hypothetical protein [Variovorax paradoxus]TWD90749.1 uncharacterized protein DUF1631 [Variovorax beijingensis]
MSTARSASSLQLARETRERFVRATEGVIVPLAQAIRDRLTQQASEIGSARTMQESRDDFVAFQGQASQWVSLAQAGWRKSVDATAGAAPAAPAAKLRLELIGDDAMESSILSSRLAQLIHDKASFELSDLRLRIQFLEGTAELDAHDVLRPETLARLLVDQWLAAGLSRALWARVQDTVQQQLVGVVVKAYEDANAFLVSRGVMPEIDLKSFVRRTGSSTGSVSPTGPATMPASPYAGGAVQRPGAAPAFTTGGSPLMVARQRAQTALLSLKRFVAARIGAEPPASPSPSMTTTGMDGHAAVAGATGAGGARAVSRTFVGAIAEAEAAYRVAASQYMQGSVPGSAEQATLIQQTAVDLRRRSTELKKRAPTTADKATVEIVALMFQAILAEERIPFSARVWFARLQMPVLRVAIAEPEFFGTLQHPARMLIDRMGSCVMGFDAAAISGSALEGEIRRVVQVIEQYPETGQRVFKLVFDEFVAFLNRYLTQSDATQRVMSVAQQVEQKETMAIQYTIELRKMLNDMPVREEIREFLFKVWAEVLAIAALRYGAQGEQTVMLKRVASELVWAASAKPNRADRARVIQDLPQLLQRLRLGMNLLGIIDEPQEAHIKAIGATLSDAFLSKTEAIPAAKIEAMAERLAHLEDFVSDDGGASSLPLDANSIELLLGVDAASIEVVADTMGGVPAEDMLAWAHELEVGNWFMLDHNDRVSQVQFVWRSDRKQLHLFASADGRSFLIQVGRLASYLQAGLLVPAEEETLTVRATREALAKLDANPERLLN